MFERNALALSLVEAVTGAASLYHRLVLVVGPSGSGKTRALAALAAAKGWPRVNVNLQLSEKLLELTQKQRAVRVAGLFEELVRDTASEVVLLDNLELLFEPELAQDPLRLLQTLSRHRVVVASWPGSLEGQALTYAEPSHREYKKYASADAVIVGSANLQPVDQAST